MAGVIATIPKFQFSANGVPMVGGTLETYIAGSTTPATTWQDSDLTSANTNPISLDARGECVLWLDSAVVYKFVLKNAAGVVQWTQDNIKTVADVANTLRSDLAAPTGASLIGGANQVVATIAALRTLLKTSPSKNAFVTGYYAAGDGGGGVYWLDASDTTTADNGGTIIVASDGGRWKLAQLSGVSVKQFGAKGDGTTVDTAAFTNAISALTGRAIYVPDPSVNYVIDATVTLPNNTTLYGQGKFSTKIFKKGNLDMFSIGDGAGFKDLWLDGQGATNTGGRGLLIGSINTSDGHQNLENCRVINFPADCIAFTNVNAGSQFAAINCEFNQYNAATGSGKYAVTIVDAAQLGAVPRKFIGCEFQGSPSFNFGGCNDLFISGSFLGDLNYTLNSRGVQISNSRVSNQTALSIYGHNHTIVGSDVNPQITLTPGVDNCHIGPNSLNTTPVIDNSNNGRNQIYEWSIAYTPTLSSGGTAPVLGNGTINGRWTRQGSTVFVTIEFTMGSTTTLGSGGLQFSLPNQSPNNLDISQVSGCVTTLHAGVLNTGVCVVPSSTQLVQLVRDTSGSITFNSPQTYSSGDIFRASFSYIVGV
jgi:hypothetical protein